MSDASSPQAIEFTAQVYKVQTLVDNGIRVTLDLPETETVTMARLAECQRFGVLLEVVCITDRNQNATRRKLETGTKRKSEWTTEERPGTNGDT
jgi:hypothetical protein